MLLVNNNFNRKSINILNTDKGVVVKDFDDDLRRVFDGQLWIAVDVDGIKDKRLVPRGTERLVQPLRRLALILKGYSGERI